MRLLPARRTPKRADLERSDTEFSFDALLGMLSEFGYAGGLYGLGGFGMPQTAPGQKQEEIGSDFRTLAQLAFKANPVVFACMAVRMRVFRQARFTFRDVVNGNAFGGAGLGLLQAPWPGGTTADLLGRMLIHADLGGNAFVARRGSQLRMLRPDWTTIVIGSRTNPDVTAWDVDAEVIGYIYRPGGPGSGVMEAFSREEVAHFAPIPDPEARFRGMSWLTPLAREVMADKAATDHKLNFFENGATPNLIVKLPAPDLKQFKENIELFKQEHEGRGNAYKTMFLAAIDGVDATAVGKDMQQITFKEVQGAGETRIAAAAGAPPVIVGLSEGLAAATYSNYGQARRHFADTTIRDLWQDACGCLGSIVDLPNGTAELWYDDGAVSFLQEDKKDAADIFFVESQAFRQLVDGGVTAESAAAAVAAKDITLVEHTGLTSVQLHTPGAQPAVPALNGSNGNRAHARDVVAALNESDTED